MQTPRPVWRRSDVLAALAIAAGALYQLRVLIRAARVLPPMNAFDVYSYFSPTLIYAADRILHHGGRGLLWNPFQNAGQPFFGTGVTGLLYPPSLLFLFLDPDRALYGVLFFNMTIGGIGAYVLCRELGLGPIAALAGGIAFAFSHAAIDVLTYTPIVSGPYAWLPWAVVVCERILRAPSVRRAVALGVVLTLALLPGHPQGLVFTYQVIALRVLWEMLTRRSWLGLQTLAAIAGGLAIPPFLAAVHLLPAIEVMRLSVRGGDLSAQEIASGVVLDWERLRRQFTLRREIFNAFQLVPLTLAGAALAAPGRLRRVFFYLLVGVLSVDLAMGSDGVLFRYYTKLPLARLFRAPERYLWMTHFAAAVLAAYGVEALLTVPTGGASGRVQRLAAVALAGLAAVGLYFLAPFRLYAREIEMLATVVAAGAVGAFVPRLRLVAAGVFVTALVLELLVYRPTPLRTLLPDSQLLFAKADVFRLLRSRMTPQDRAYLVPEQAHFDFQHKTASLFAVPSLFDYESLPSRRWAEYFTMLRTGVPMTGLMDIYYPTTGWMPPSTQRPLLDACAAHFVVVEQNSDAPKRLSGPGLVPVTSLQGVDIYENTAALPRAYWVPRVQVGRRALELMARGMVDLRTVALVESPPPSGFLGEPGDATGSRVTFARDDPEHLILQVDAPRRGFLVVADQEFPGWIATVDGAPAAILRANHVFRVVEVPAGHSTVTLRYRPRSVMLGALVSATTLAGIAVLLARSRRRTE